MIDGIEILAGEQRGEPPANLILEHQADVGEIKRCEESSSPVRRQPVPIGSADPVTPRPPERRGGRPLRLSTASVSMPDATQPLWPTDEWDVHREAATAVASASAPDRTWRRLQGATGSVIEVLTYGAGSPSLVAAAGTGRVRRTSPQREAG